ncbi:MAG: AI-2E family transporter, partial [Thermosynechococcaceae cyanobacterium]
MKRIGRLPPWVIWGLLLPLVALNFWVALQIFRYLQSFFTIFAAATLLSFVLDYPIRLLQRLRLSRAGAVLVILLLAVGLCILLGITIIPALARQLNDLVQNLPTLIQSSGEQLQFLQRWAENSGWSIDISQWSRQLEERLATQLQTWSGQV